MNKHKTVAIQRSIETGERHPLAHFDSRRYVQHNLALGDGLAAVLAFVDSLPAGTSRVTPLRAFEDGDITFAHFEYVLAPLGHIIGFELHRWENGHIVEHWDNLQPVPAGLNASGRSMTDGPTEVGDTQATTTTKALVERFSREVLVGSRHEALDELVHEQLAEHSPDGADGAEGLRATLEARRAAGTAHHRVERVLGEGDFALVLAEGELAGEPAAFYDLYRVHDGRIAEHWDVVQAIPPRSEWANDNGKF